MRNEERIVEHLQQRYTYDSTAGVVRNRKGQVIKGFDNGQGYLLLDARVDGNRHVIKLHQLVWVLVYGRFPSMIDHINGNEKDNRIENLREVTRSENDMNRVWTWKPNPSTGLPGVSKCRNSFQITVDGKCYYFHDKYEAFLTLVMLGRMFKDN